MQVHYYDTLDFKLIKTIELSYDKTPERFPPNLTSATALQNGFIYVFSGNQYCVREMTYESEDKNKYVSKISKVIKSVGMAKLDGSRRGSRG